MRAGLDAVAATLSLVVFSALFQPQPGHAQTSEQTYAVHQDESPPLRDIDPADSTTASSTVQ
jgi:hypothetical protein